MAPSYELALIAMRMDVPKLARLLAPTCQLVQKSGGVVRDVQSLGAKALPYRMKTQSGYQVEGVYTFMQFDAPTSALDQMRKELNHNQDIIRHNIASLPDPNRESKRLFHRCRQNAKFVSYRNA